MARWTLDDINWSKFDASKVEPGLLAIAKAACMVEYNGGDYARYLKEVFHDDPKFQQIAEAWAEEEVQHGRALRKWAELADPTFDFEESFRTFTTGYKLPQNVVTSVRGSQAGEMIARCIVEIGTSAYYTALRDYTLEPVHQQICARIAQDEIAHYKLFLTSAQELLARDGMGFWKKLQISLGRIAESEDDELAYAFYSANLNTAPGPYNHKEHMRKYLNYVYPLYRQKHVESMVAMLVKVIGLKRNGWLNRLADKLAWKIIQHRVRNMPAAETRAREEARARVLASVSNPQEAIAA